MEIFSSGFELLNLFWAAQNTTCRVPVNTKKYLQLKKKEVLFFIDSPSARKPGFAVGGAGGGSASPVKLDFFGRSFDGAAGGAASFKKMSIAQAAMERHARVGKGWAHWLCGYFT